MAGVTVRLQVVTPLFMGGAHPRGEPPELRAQSVRGALRWWLRALLGGCGWAGPDFQDTEVLWQEEAKVFGSAAAESGGASPVVVRVSDIKAGIDTIQKTNQRGNGQDYLLYGMHEQSTRDRDNYQAARRYYTTATSFTLHFDVRPGAKNGEEALHQVCTSLWLLVSLGGLGSRSRRGAGCLDVVELAKGWPADLPPIFDPTSSPSTLQLKLEQGLTQIRSTLGAESFSPLPGVVSPFTLLHPALFEVYVLDKTWGTWQQAMDAVGQAFAGTRMSLSPDMKVVADFLQSGTVPWQIHRAVLGLPLPFYFTNLGIQRKVKATVNGSKHDRSASPLTFHFTRLKNRSLCVLLTASHQRLLPDGEDLTISSGGRTGRTASLPVPGTIVFDRLLSDVKTALATSTGTTLNRVAY
ncbi:MAG: type III-B CRISPR module RAMP protein Cmr1 [Chloroflexota bacterium]|nr:type III-B CRISPR module RAMP protein Cmr1 [Chloroflexota bacterium]